ncbi:hypothetical protein ACHAQA_005684 [Verticillium albo-atrum]
MAQPAHDWTLVQPDKKKFILSQQKRIILWALYASIGSAMLGFDYGLTGTITAFPAFQKTMGIPYPSQPSGYLIPAYVQSAWSGLGMCGHVLGVLASGGLMDPLGRKRTIMFGNILTGIGIGIQVASNDWKMFLAGRLINAIGFGIVFVVGPVWIGETVRPELRGFFLCITNATIVIGQFILSLVAYGTAKIPGKWSYQSLVILQFVFVAAIGVPWFWFPESPYWLMRKNREESAKASLLRIHGSRCDGLIEAEFTRIQEMMVGSDELAHLANVNGPPIMQALKPPHLKRTFIAILPPLAQQLIGATFVLGYITYFLSLLGIEDYFTVSVALYCVMLVSNLSAFFLVESAGRRWLMISGMVFLTVTELIMGIMGFINNSAALWVTLVCIFLWALVYQLTIGAIGFAVAGEVASPPLRATTMSLTGATQGTSGWIIGFITPYMINPDAGNLGPKVGFVFAGLGLPMCVLFWFLIPETKGLTLDVIDTLFAEGVKPRHFRKEGKRVTAAVLAGNTAHALDGTKNHAVDAEEIEVAENSP